MSQFSKLKKLKIDTRARSLNPGPAGRGGYGTGRGITEVFMLFMVTVCSQYHEGVDYKNSRQGNWYVLHTLDSIVT